MRRCKYVLVTLSIFSIFILYPKSSSADTFTGYVYDRADGLPIEGAVVAVGNWSWPPIGVVYFDTTDAQGYYQVTDLPSANDYTILIIATGYVSRDSLLQQPPANVNFYLRKHTSGFLVKTFNHGYKVYQWNGSVCYREEGIIDENQLFFPDIDAECDTISALLDSIGAGTDATEDDSLIWQKCSTLWDWLRNNASFRASDPDWQTASSFMMSQNWPSIEMIARTYMIYGFIPWGSCMSKAQTFTTLLYRTGVPKARIAIAEARTKLRYSQHMYTVLFLGRRWLYLDPGYTPSPFPSYGNYTSVPVLGAGYFDYCHPHRMMTIPGSGLTVVPEITNRLQNTEQVFIASPPMNTHTLLSSIDVDGISYDSGTSDMWVNGVACPIVNNQFQATVELSVGKNVITAEVSSVAAVKADSIVVFRDCETTTGIPSTSTGIVFPKQFRLEQNTPNPFNPSTTIRFHVPRSCFVVLKAYDLLGREVETLVNEHKKRGSHKVRWITRGLPSGVYLICLTAEDFTDTKKVVLQK